MGNSPPYAPECEQAIRHEGETASTGPWSHPLCRTVAPQHSQYSSGRRLPMPLSATLCYTVLV